MNAPADNSTHSCRVCGRAWIALAWLAAAGCAGYRFGSDSLYRSDVRTVYVPMMQSDSYRRHLGERLTEAVVKEIEKRTPYKVVDNPHADTVLTGRLQWDTKQVLTEDANDNPRDIEVHALAHFTWIDQRGNMLMEPLTLDVAAAASFVPEAGQSVMTAQQAAIEKTAAQIVNAMELPPL